MRFTWDEAKRKANFEKHGLDFADAYRVFERPVVEFDDTRFHYEEQWLIALGLLDTLIVLVVHVERGNPIRIISMRKANKHETNLYFKRLG